MTGKKELFSIEEGVHYLNCAYMSPLMKSVEKAGIAGIQRKSRPYNIKPADFFTEVSLLKEEFARIIHSPDPSRIAIIPSVSYGITTVANNLKAGKGDNMVLVGEQFPSNVYAWRELSEETGMELRTVSAPDKKEGRAREWNQRILEAIDKNTRAVALANVHWADGTLFKLKQIKQALKPSGGWLIVDGTQSVGALPIDVMDIGIDALICAGYKWLMGPYSMGLAYFGPVFDHGKPIEHSWMNRNGAEDFAGLVKYTDQFQPGAGRFSVGESSNFALVPMQLEALKQLNKWGVEEVANYARELFRPFESRFRESGYFIEEEEYRGSHLLGLRKEGIDVTRLAAKLAESKVYVSIRGSAIRVSISVFNTQEDLEKLLENS